ncbi:DUF4360 domain-containing protein [Actinomadura decatromicini]|nr:DUF4360 domain-containing protein [Actinomadura decatromicini]
MAPAKRKAIALFGAVVATSALAVPAASASPPPPGGVTIEIANVSNPKSCPPPAVAVADPLTAFSVTYSGLEAVAGGDSAPADRLKRCQLNLRIHVPSTYTYGFERIDYRGSAHLQTDVQGTVKARVYFQGMSSQWPQPTLSLKGPYSSNWQAVAQVPPEQVVYKPCGEERSLLLDNELAVDLGNSDPSKTSFISMDSPDGSVKSIYHVVWKTCP